MPIIDLVTEIEATFDYSRNSTCVNRIDNAKSCFACCQNRYFNGRGIDYECDQFRKAYILRYLPVHIHENYLALRRIPRDVIEVIGQNETVNMLSLGGGPGTDIAAFKKFVGLGHLDDMATRSFRIVRIEREDGWNGLARSVHGLFDCGNFEIIHRRKHQDVLVPFRQDNIHIVTISYLISEIDTENIPILAKNINRVLAGTAVIIVNDRDEEVVRTRAEVLFRNIGNCTFTSRNGREHCGEFFPDDLRDRVVPKLKTNSIRYTAVKQ